MGIAILGGCLKGFSLKVPKGDVVRPTSILLRRRIFDAHQDFTGQVFVDFCAGSGAVGFEAWSRGAAAVYFIEPDRQVYRCLQDNISSVSNKFCDEVRVRALTSKNCKAEAWLDQFKTIYQSWPEETQQNTIFYLDPPYESHSIYHAILELLKGDWFVGELWLESDRQKGKPSSYWESLGVQEIKLYTQGTSYVLKGKIC